MDVWEYFETRERECREHSLAPEPAFSEMALAEAGSDGQRGAIFGRLILNKRAFLALYESVVVVGSGVHREVYSYYLIYDGAQAWGYERDPTHSPAVHGHVGSDHARVQADRVSFREVATKAWETVSAEEYLEQ